MRSTRFCRILAFAFAAWLSWHRAAPAAAQQATVAPRFPAEAAPPPASFNDALQTPIDPSTYLLGPGDGLMISIYARTPDNYAVDVSPDGFIQLPTIGALSVRGKTPVEVQAIVDLALRRVRKDFRLSVRTVR